MTFTDAIRTCFQNYATFSGRAARPEFWWFVLFLLLANLVLGTLDSMLFFGDMQLLTPLFSLATLLPALAVSVRRLHDLDRTGWWLLLYLIPLIGILVLLYFYVQRGDQGTNRFGPPPAR